MKPIPSFWRIKELLHYDPETGIFRWRWRHHGRVRETLIAGTVHKSDY